MEDIYLARQPIYNRQLDVVGYELLYREDDRDQARFSDGTRASSRLIINTFIGLGLENIVGSNPAFINLTEDFFFHEQPIPMSNEQIVLELRVDQPPHGKVFDSLQELSRKGYRIALDDFSYRPELEPLMGIAHVAKLDLALLGREGMSQQVAHCRAHQLEILAEKVETHEDLAFCRELGIDYFQGYFFCKPQLMRGRAEPANRAVVMQLLNRLQDPDVSMEELEHIIIQDVALTYKLLRYLNCATYALRREISSVRDALLLLGTQTVKKWATLLMMSSYADDKPSELIAIALIRARMCELLAKPFQVAPDMAFTVGLFSVLDAVMDTPMEELLDTIALKTEIKFALLDQEGALGMLLGEVLNYESGIWPADQQHPLGARDYAQAYLAAVQWAREYHGALHS